MILCLRQAVVEALLARETTKILIASLNGDHLVSILLRGQVVLRGRLINLLHPTRELLASIGTSIEVQCGKPVAAKLITLLLLHFTRDIIWTFVRAPSHVLTLPQVLECLLNHLGLFGEALLLDFVLQIEVFFFDAEILASLTHFEF